MSENNEITSEDTVFSETVQITSKVSTPKASGGEGTYTGYCPTGHPVRHAPIKNGKKKCTTCDREF